MKTQIRNKRLVPIGKKMITDQLLQIADIFIDSAEDEFHMDTYSKGYLLVQLAKRELK